MRPHDSGVRGQCDRESPDRRRAHQAGGPARRTPDRDRSAAHRAGRIRRLSSRHEARDEHRRCSTRWRTRSSPRASATAHSSSAGCRRSTTSRAFIAAWPPERAAATCGVEAETIRRAARLYASESPAISVHGLGLTEHVQGTDGVMALINLALLTGNVGKPGAGVNPLRGQNNVQGAAHMGCDPAVLAGSTPIDRGRQAFEAPLGRTAARHARTAHAGDDGCGRRRTIEGAVGDRLRRAADQSQCHRDRSAPCGRSIS